MPNPTTADGTLIYTATRKFINYLFPVPVFHYNQSPPLHWLQHVAGLGFRIYSNVTYVELFRNILSTGTYAPLHHPHFPASAAIIDQVDVNIIQRLALTYHPYDGAYPFRNDNELREITVINEEEEEEEDNIIVAPMETTASLNADTSESATPTLTAYEDSSSHVYSMTHKPIRCDNVKVAIWYSTRLTVAVSAGFLINFALSQLQQDKEALTDSQRMAYNAAVCAATVLTERFFEECMPWVIRKTVHLASACWSRLFSRPAPQPEVEADPLLVSPSPF